MSGVFDFALECFAAYSQIQKLYENYRDMDDVLKFVGLPGNLGMCMYPDAVVKIMEALLKKVREERDKKL